MELDVETVRLLLVKIAALADDAVAENVLAQVPHLPSEHAKVEMLTAVADGLGVQLG